MERQFHERQALTFTLLAGLFSCEGAALGVLMYVCPSMCHQNEIQVCMKVPEGSWRLREGSGRAQWRFREGLGKFREGWRASWTFLNHLAWAAHKNFTVLVLLHKYIWKSNIQSKLKKGVTESFSDKDLSLVSGKLGEMKTTSISDHSLLTYTNSSCVHLNIYSLEFNLMSLF